MKFFPLSIITIFCILVTFNIFAAVEFDEDNYPAAPSYTTCAGSYEYKAGKNYEPNTFFVSNFELDFYFDESSRDTDKNIPHFASLRISTYDKSEPKIKEVLKFGITKKNIKSKKREVGFELSGNIYYFLDDDENYYLAMDYFAGGISFNMVNDYAQNSTATLTLRFEIEFDEPFKEEKVKLQCTNHIWE